MAVALMAEVLMLALTLPMLTFTLGFSASFASGDGESLLPVMHTT